MNRRNLIHALLISATILSANFVNAQVTSEKAYAEERTSSISGPPGVDSGVGAQTTVTRSVSEHKKGNLDKKIDGPIVARNQDLNTLITLLQTESGIQFILGENINKKVTFTLDSPTIRTILDTVLPANGMNYVVNNNVVLVDTKEKIRRYKFTDEKSLVTSEKSYAEEERTSPSISGPPGVDSNVSIQETVTNYKSPCNKLNKKIDGPVIARNQDFKTIAQLLQVESGILIVLGEGLNKKVTFSLDSPTIRVVLDTVLPPNGMDYMVVGDIVRIDTKEKIRQCKITENTNTSSGVKETRKSISVMCKVLDHQLNKTLDGDYQSQGIFARGSRGFWVPGTGAMFILGVKFPLIQSREEIKRRHSNGEKDLWDQFENGVVSKTKDVETVLEIIGGVNMDRKVSKEFNKYDSQKVQTLRNTIFEILAKYGSRLEGLGQNETVTLIIEGEGGNPFQVFGPYGDSNVSISVPGEPASSIGVVVEDNANEHANEFSTNSSNSNSNRIEIYGDFFNNTEKLNKDMSQRQKEIEKKNLELNEKFNKQARGDKQKDQESLKAYQDQLRSLQLDQQKVVKQLNQARARSDKTRRQSSSSRTLARSTRNLALPRSSGYSFFGDNTGQPQSTMIIQIPYKCLPKRGGKVDDIMTELTITTY